jgi:hypothetical protein
MKGNGGPKGERNVNWHGGIFKYPNHYAMKKARLQKLKETDGKCEICGNLANEIHHKDETKTNHEKSNLIVVCHKCHAALFHSGPRTKRWKWTDEAKIRWSIKKRNLCYEAKSLSNGGVK